MPFNNHLSMPFRYLDIAGEGPIPPVGTRIENLKCFRSEVLTPPIDSWWGDLGVEINSRALSLCTYHYSTNSYTNGFFSGEYDKLTLVIRTSHILENAEITVRYIDTMHTASSPQYIPLSDSSLITVLTIDINNYDSINFLDFGITIPVYPTDFYFEVTECLLFSTGGGTSS